MNFKINFDIQPPQSKINIKQNLMMMGSCFAENIGEKLLLHKFNNLINPNGILFNPINIFDALHSYIEGKIYTENDLFLYDELWYSWQYHGRFADIDKEAALTKINDSQKLAIAQIKNVDHLILTFGSAYVYELKDSNEIVSNCHKVPQQKFNKRLLSVKEIVDAFNKSNIKNLKSNIILTVSPVRYFRDGLVENNHSKAILIQAVHELIREHKNLYFFPAYEIVMDELRDYRFFENDLVHPNDLAVGYVWERFCETMLDDETKNFVKSIDEILSAKNHRPFNPNTQKHLEFLNTYLTKTELLNKAFPFLNLEAEKNYFRK
ncbi:MAG: GSCFA domain-containing protein [Bacteroidota bacterium]